MRMTPHNSRPAFGVLAALTLVAALTIAIVAQPAMAKSGSKRVVALTPFGANTLVTTGNKPVAIGQMAIGKKGMSPKLKKVKQLPLSHPNGPNMEQIAQIDPDVVLTSSEWAKGTQTMRDLAITVRTLEPKTVADVVPLERTIGYAYGSRKLTNRLVAQTKREIDFARKGTKKHPHPIKQRPTVMLILGVGRTPYVFLPNSWAGSIAKAAGAKLLGGELKQSSGLIKVSDEYVVQQDPDVIIAVPHGNASDITSISDHLKSNPAWSSTKAVQSGNVYVTLDDALLQPNTDVGDTIKRVRVGFLKNW